MLKDIDALLSAVQKVRVTYLNLPLPATSDTISDLTNDLDHVRHLSEDLYDEAVEWALAREVEECYDDFDGYPSGDS